ncbi:caspase-3 [Aplysia californica]|uniref:Caspase-3 n=1 Tax=Aplysia californica TaxID=6500 RepID=A0ABM0JRI5_APLCA|nr:caspase-3 [Aplysia californica]
MDETMGICDETDFDTEGIYTKTRKGCHKGSDNPVPALDSSDNYNFSHERRGVAIIIVNHNFSGQRSRDGSQQDFRRLQELFTSLDFEIRTFRDVTRNELLQLIHNVSREDHSDCDCLVVAISSHGNSRMEATQSGYQIEDTISTRDGQVETRLIMEKFRDRNCPSLIGKPKLFFIQACRGSRLDDGMELPVLQPVRLATEDLPPTLGNLHLRDALDACLIEEEEKNGQGPQEERRPQRVPTDVRREPCFVNVVSPAPQRVPTDVRREACFVNVASPAPQRIRSEVQREPCFVNVASPAPCYLDFLVMYATPPGYFAFRRENQGSWFITCLYNVLSRNRGDKSLVRQLTSVTGLMIRDMVSVNTEKPHQDSKKQTPVLYSMLTKDIYLVPKADKTSARRSC